MKMAEQQDWRGDDLSDVLDLKSLLIPAKKALRRNPLSLLISDPTGEEEGWQEKYGRDEEGNLIVTDPKEREQNFKHWFGDSKVVDKGGKPLAMYHGTQKGGFSEFDVYGSSKHGLFGSGGYFTEDPEVASGYADKTSPKAESKSPAVYRVHLSIKNPIDMDAPANKSNWAKVLEDFGYSPDEYETLRKQNATNEAVFKEVEDDLEAEGVPMSEGSELIQDMLRGMGHDGITHMGGGRANKKSEKRHRVYIIFDPTQAKSVHNRGLFNPANPDILSKRVNPKKSLKIPA